MKNNIISILGSFFFLIPFGCNKTGFIDDPYIDPHIIFTSRRWWNYDIYITDIYGVDMTHLTKNKWIDFNPSISPDGKKLAFISDRDGNREIYTLDLVWMDGYKKWEGRNLSNISNNSQHDWTPVFSPTNDKIVYSSYFPQNDNYDIFIMDIDGANKQNLTNSRSYEKYPQFSPDGSFIIYQGWVKGKMEIFFTSLLDNNRINLTRNLKAHDIISIGNAFSPDGQRVVFTSERDGNRNIYIMNINGTEQMQLTSHESNDYEPIFSPDGQRVVFTSERDGNREIYIFDFESNKLTNLTNNLGDDWNPRFYHNHEKIIFQSTRDGNWELYIMGTDGSKQKNLTNHSATDYSFVVLPLTNPIN